MKMIEVFVEGKDFSIHFENSFYKIKKNNTLVTIGIDYTEMREKFRKLTGV